MGQALHEEKEPLLKRLLEQLKQPDSNGIVPDPAGQRLGFVTLLDVQASAPTLVENSEGGHAAHAFARLTVEKHRPLGQNVCTGQGAHSTPRDE